MGEKRWAALPDDGCDGAGVSGKFEFRSARIGDADVLGERPRQLTTDDRGDSLFLAAPRIPGGELGVSGENAVQRLRRARHRPESKRRTAA